LTGADDATSKRKPRDLLEAFESTCGWCGRSIPPDTPVFGGGGKARLAVDLSAQAGQVIPVRLVRAGKTILVAISALDSEATCQGDDFMYMGCSKDCAQRLRDAFQADIDAAKRSGPADGANQ
jgi:hypothetical protein